MTAAKFPYALHRGFGRRATVAPRAFPSLLPARRPDRLGRGRSLAALRARRDLDLLRFLPRTGDDAGIHDGVRARLSADRRAAADAEPAAVDARDHGRGRPPRDDRRGRSRPTMGAGAARLRSDLRRHAAVRASSLPLPVVGPASAGIVRLGPDGGRARARWGVADRARRQYRIAPLGAGARTSPGGAGRVSLPRRRDRQPGVAAHGGGAAPGRSRALAGRAP